jgi:hypothetical protein
MFILPLNPILKRQNCRFGARKIGERKVIAMIALTILN